MVRAAQFPVAVEPEDRNAGVARPGDVLMQIVADIDGPLRLRLQPVEARLEDSRIRFANALLDRDDHGIQEGPQPLAVQESMHRRGVVEIRDEADPVSRFQRLEQLAMGIRQDKGLGQGRHVGGDGPANTGGADRGETEAMQDPLELRFTGDLNAVAFPLPADLLARLDKGVVEFLERRFRIQLQGLQRKAGRGGDLPSVDDDPGKPVRIEQEKRVAEIEQDGLGALHHQ